MNIYSKIIRYLSELINKNKKGECINMADETTTTTTTTDADTIKEAAVDAAVASVTSSLTDEATSTDFISNLILRANEKIDELKAEEESRTMTGFDYVRDIRNPAEIIIIKALIAAAAAGGTAAIAALTKKLG